MRKAFVNTLLEAAKKNPKILLVTGDLGFGVLDDFEKILPNQFLNAGVTEQSMMSLASGYASMGHHVFVYSIGNFPTFRCLEQIRNDVCYMGNAVTVVAVGAGYSYGAQGYSHHALEDISIMRTLPGMNVIVPMDPTDAIAATNHLLENPGPSYLRVGRDGESNFISVSKRESINNFNELQKGDKGTILFVGSIGKNAKLASEQLLQSGIDVSVAGCTNISNLDSDYLNAAAKKGPILTVEEHTSVGGFGSAVLEHFASTRNSIPRIGIIGAARSNLMNIGDHDYLLNSNGLSVENIKVKFEQLL